MQKMRYISDTPHVEGFGRMKGYEMAKLSHLYGLPTVSTPNLYWGIALAVCNFAYQ
jgi:hypothetical protein